MSKGAAFFAIIHNIIVWPLTWGSVTRLAYNFTQSPYSKLLLGLYAKLYKVNIAEMEYSINAYPTIAALFERRLKQGKRPICPFENSIVSPVDAIVTSMGMIGEQTVLKAKGKEYALCCILQNSRQALQFIGGQYVVLYLPVGAYHRVHSPADARVIAEKHIAGRHFPLYDLSERSIRKIYSRNTRHISLLCLGAKGAGSIRRRNLKTGRRAAQIAMVQIASTLVGTIENRFTAAEVAETRPNVRKGEEFSVFKFGSTVILFFTPEIKICESIKVGDSVKMGEKIAYR